MSLAEYLYIDNKRLDSYAGQIREGLVSKRNENSSGLDISLTGPKVSVSSKETQWKNTPHEKILRLKDYLIKNNEIELGNRRLFKTVPFYEKEFYAHKIIIPKTLVANPNVYDINQLVIWVSTDNEQDLTILLEDCGDDSKNYETVSSFSALYLTLRNLDINYKELGEITIHDDLSPIDYFKKIGAEVLPQRKIKTLYRLRMQGAVVPMAYDGPDPICGPIWGVFGYPIYIAEVFN